MRNIHSYLPDCAFIFVSRCVNSGVFVVLYVALMRFFLLSVQDIEICLQDHTLDKKTRLQSLGRDLMANSIMSDHIKSQIDAYSDRWNILDCQVMSAQTALLPSL